MAHSGTGTSKRREGWVELACDKNFLSTLSPINDLLCIFCYNVGSKTKHFQTVSYKSLGVRKVKPDS